MVLVIRKQPKEEKAFDFLAYLPFLQHRGPYGSSALLFLLSLALSAGSLAEDVLGVPEAGPELRICVQKMYLESQKGSG